MAKKTRNILKSYFESGKKPTEGQYANLIDSHALLSGENTGSFKLKGDANINGNLTASGNITAGTFKGDGSRLTNITSSNITQLTVTASIATGSLTVSGSTYFVSGSTNVLLAIKSSGSIVPGTTHQYDLGAPLNQWKALFVSESVTRTIHNEGKSQIGTSLQDTHTFIGNITSSGTLSGSTIIYTNEISEGDITKGLTFTGNITASGNISASKKIFAKEGYVGGTVRISGSTYYESASVEILEGLGVTGSIIPGANNEFDLGSPSHVWRDLFLSENSIRFVSSSGEVTRFKQKDVKDLKEGKSLKQDVAIDGADKFTRTEALFHQTANNHYIKQTTAGLWQFQGPGGSPLSINQVDADHAISINTPGIFSTKGSISASLITATHKFGGTTQFGHGTVTINGPAGHITASGNISASGTIFANSFQSTGGDVGGISFIDHVNITGDISASGGGSIFAFDTDNAASIGLADANGLRIAQFARVGSGVNAHLGRMVLHNQNLGSQQVDISAYGSSFYSGSNNSYFGIGTTNPTVELQVEGIISASGNISNLGSISTTHITASGNISASGDILNTGNIIVGGKILLTDSTAANYIDYDGTGFLYKGSGKFLGNITASGNISSSGTIIGSSVVNKKALHFLYTTNKFTLDTSDELYFSLSDADRDIGAGSEDQVGVMAIVPLTGILKHVIINTSSDLSSKSWEFKVYRVPSGADADSGGKILMATVASNAGPASHTSKKISFVTNTADTNEILYETGYNATTMFTASDRIILSLESNSDATGSPKINSVLCFELDESTI